MFILAVVTRFRSNKEDVTMKKRAELGLLMAMLAAGAIGATYAGPKYLVNHLQGNGIYEVICVSQSAWESSHINHEGDQLLSTSC